jgi:HAD superfamily hydrolase (TIGR01509 family)
MAAEYALLFDCDGVIVETEELHRLAYNAAFEKFGLKLNGDHQVEWSVEYYDILQNTVGGGKPKMKYYFNTEKRQWPISTRPYRAVPTTDDAKNSLVDDLQDAKTFFYKEILGQVAKARPGVLELMDAAIADPTIKVGICSAATKAGFIKVVDTIVGQERLSKLDVIMAGDDVTEKKPDPMIYNTARERIGISADKCVVIEDSMVGLRAAKGANMKCIITYTDSTADADFYGEGADAKVPDLSNVTLDAIFGPLKAGATSLLEGIKDPMSATASKTPVAAVREEVAPGPAYTGWSPHYTTVQ